MYLGISSYTYGWAVGGPSLALPARLNEMDLVELARAFGLGALQIGDNLPLHELDDERLNALVGACREHHIRLEIGAAGLTDQHLNTYIAIASRANAPIIRFVTDKAGYKPSPDEICSIIRNQLPLLKQNGIKIGIENHDRLKAMELANIMEHIGDEHCGICLDCANSLGAGEGLEHVVSVLAPYTINLHFKDFAIERLPHKMGFTITGAKPGTGMLDAAFLLDTLVQYNRCESAILEQWVVPDETMDHTVEKERAWAEAGVAYLKEHIIN